METPSHRKWTEHTFFRVTTYAVARAFALFVAIVISISLTILVTSRSGVLESEMSGSRIKGWLSGPARVILPNIPTTTDANASPLFNFFSLLIDGLTFNFAQGPIYAFYDFDPAIDTLKLVLDALTRTLVLFGLSNLLVFVCSLALALTLTQRYGSALDKLIISLSPLSSIPAWIYALVFTIFFAKVFEIFPNPMLARWPEEWNWNNFQSVLKSFSLPIISIFLSKFFQSTYTWRTLFLIQAGEEFVDLAKAKGMPEKDVSRRYILRPALPYVITNFSMMMVNTWQEALLMEVFFGISGIGHLFYAAMRNAQHNMPFLLTLTAFFAYLLASNVFVLDIVYALIDPRVRIGRQNEKPRAWKQGFSLRGLREWLRAGKGRQNAIPQVQFQRTPATSAPLTRLKAPQARLSLSFLRRWVQEIARYPSAIPSLVVIAIMVGCSIYTLIALPFEKTISLWRNTGNIWEYNPKLAAPAWTNTFRKDKLPVTLLLEAHNDARQTVEVGVNGMQTITTVFEFDFPYASPPQDIMINFRSKYLEKRPFLTVTWLTPDGRSFDLGNFSTQVAQQKFYFSTEERLARKLRSKEPVNTLFYYPDTDQTVAGTYQLRIDAIFFEEKAAIDPEVVLFGKVFGLAGTDNRRRDLMIPLLWGMPIALALGVVGAIGGSLFTLWLAAVGSWFGGSVDRVIQGLTEVNMVLPAFPLMVFVYISYSKSIWVILSLALLLSIGGSAIKNYRAAFLQVREAGYIESPQVYGASNWRIIFVYLMPRLLPVVVPHLVGLIPGIFFLEATLAYLNISDPVLPTWGKLLQEALAGGALNGAYYWALEPLGMLLICGLAFALLGFALDRILNPRLRSH